MVSVDQLRGEAYTGGDPVVEGMYADNRARLGEVLAGVRGGSVVPLLGAGFSAGSIPLWRGVLLGWARRLGPAVEAEVTRLLDAGDFEGAASLVKSETGANAFRDAFEGTFGEGVLDGAFDKLTPERRGIPFAFRGFVLTTNYDRLVERAYEAAGARLETVCPHTAYHLPQAAGGLQGNKPLLLKLHGDAWDPTNAVITREDYDRVYGTGDEVAPLVEVMRRAFTGRRVLFLGCSLAGDRPLDVLHGCCEGATHYALVELPAGTENPADPLAPALVDADGRQAPAYREARLRLDELGIRPIWYPHGQHEALDALLGWLEKEMGPLPGASATEDKTSKDDPIPRSIYGCIGRDDIIGKIVSDLSKKDPQITFVTGPGGIGKTEICRKVLRELRAAKRSVVYVSVAGAKNAWTQCDAAMSALGCSPCGETEGFSFSDYASLVSKRTREIDRPIVYFDNWEDAWVGSDEAEHEKLVSLLKVIASSGAGVLVSSREVIATEVPEFNYEAIETGLDRPYDFELFKTVYVRKGGSDSISEESCRSLLNKISGHPLSLVLVATHAVELPTWDGVEETWDAAHQAIGNAVNNECHGCLQTALRLSWNAVSDTPLTHELWIVMSLTPGELNASDLSELAKYSGEPRREWNSAFTRLRRASLLSVHNERLVMLRPVKEAPFIHIVDGLVIDLGLADDILVHKCLDWLEAWFLTVISDDDDGQDASWTGQAHDTAIALLPNVFYLLTRAVGIRGISECEAKLARALTNYYQLDWAHSRPALEKMLDASQASANAEIAALSAQTLGECSFRLGNIQDVEQYLSLAIKLHEQLDDRVGLAYDYKDRAELELRRENLSGARNCLSKALQLHRDEMHLLGVGNDLQDLAELDIRCGNLNSAEVRLIISELLHQKKGYGSLGVANSCKSRADIAFLRGQLDISEELYSGAEANYRQLRSLLGVGNCLKGRAKIAIYRKNTREAKELLNEAKDHYKEAGNRIGIANVNQLEGMIALLEGDCQESKKKLEYAMDIHRAVGSQDALATDSRIYAQILIKEGDYDRAVKCLNNALNTHESSENCLEAGDDYYFGYALLAEAKGDSGGVRAALEKAKKMYLAAGSKLGVEAVEKYLDGVLG